ncbi:MAG TPA: hypothetical protein VN408_01970 [Actinoplanes sp.]|nr:hypothetical protein [Actinoplanes sp.]
MNGPRDGTTNRVVVPSPGAGTGGRCCWGRPPTAEGRGLLRQALPAHVPQMNQDLLGAPGPIERLVLPEPVRKVPAHTARGPAH